MPDLYNILVLMIVVWTCGLGFRRMGLPMVFGELIGGVIVGPTMLGMVDIHSHAIEVLAELGIFFLMLHTGLKTDHEELLSASKKSIFVAAGGIILPFLGGYLVSREFGLPVETALFIAVGISASAIALVARTFKECGIENSRVAHLSLGAAIIGDILTLILFSMIINLSQSGELAIAPLLWILLKVCVFFVVVIWGGIRTAPYMKQFLFLGNKGFTLTLIIALALGMIAEAIGLHMIIGALLAGLFIREEVLDPEVFQKIEDRIYGLSYSFLGPIFFASLAFHLEFSAIWSVPFFLLSVIAVAFLGKFIGGGGIAWLLRLKPIEAILVGLAMNHRGTVELIIASIGLELGLIDTTVFSILVMTSMATSVLSILMAGPFAKRLKVAVG